MKNTLLILLTVASFLSCKAQTFPLFNPSDDFDTNNAYYKDLDNDLTKLVGTWRYINGNQIFKITIKKKLHVYSDLSERGLSIYEDFIYGEYQYIDANGVALVNSLSNIDVPTDISQHLIFGNFIRGKNDFPVCEDCSISERRVEVMLIDPARTYFDYDLEIRHIAGELNNPDQIKVIIRRSDMAFVPEGEPMDDRLPLRTEFVLTKQ